MQANIDGLKGWAVVAGDADDAPLALCLEASKRWFANAGVPEVGDGEPDSFLYVMGVYMLATHYYDNRGALIDSKLQGVNASMPYGVNAIRLQLQKFTHSGVHT